jgi:hypothetical protein
MDFFDYVKNESFFKPLVLKYRRIYYESIQILIDKSKELPVLYESDAKDAITIYLKNIDIQKLARTIGNEDEEKTAETWDDSNVELKAAPIMNLFRECGWLMPREIGRNGEYIVNISTDCRRIMDFLAKMTEKSGDGAMSNRIFSMYEIIKSAFEENSLRMERPYANILVPLIDNEMELKNELIDLKDSIAAIMKTVVAFQDMNGFGQFILKDAMLDKFFSEYFFIKHSGLIPAQISYIRSKLRVLRQGDVYEKMIFECAEKLEISKDEATARVERYFAELQYFLSNEYEENMELIDKRINGYYNLANTRIMLMASSGMKLESALSDFLNGLAGLPEPKKHEAINKVAECVQITNQQYVGYKSIEKNKRAKNASQNIALQEHPLSDEEKRQKTEAIFESAQNRYALDRVGKFLQSELGKDKKISLKERQIGSREAALMYAAAMLYAGNDEFPYKLELCDEMIKNDIVDINNIVITKK